MSFHIPTNLTDPMVRDHDVLPHGETMTIDRLSSEVDRRKEAWLSLHSGWTFTCTNLVRCSDGTALPAYDVSLEFHRPRTQEELARQTEERLAFESRRKADLLLREQAQKELLQEVLASLEK